MVSFSKLNKNLILFLFSILPLIDAAVAIWMGAQTRLHIFVLNLLVAQLCTTFVLETFFNDFLN